MSSSHPLADFAWQVHDLLRSPEARQRFRAAATACVKQGLDFASPPPTLPDEDAPRVLSLDERYGMLLALHAVVCHSEEQHHPAPWPDDLEAGQDIERAKAALVWECLLSGARDLGAEDRLTIESFLADVRHDLRGEEPERPGALSSGADAVDDEDLSILRELSKQSPRLLTTYAIEAETRIARKTVGQRLQRLMALNLVHRPNGPRRGVTLTKKGEEFLGRVPPPK